ncbi:hypothetical protein NKG99_20490 [Mesorhizobium sp. M1409]|uniref:hypothetical protein n=1 Tax=Mesorhizobium sp. M1409 TaxID=2957100 RepID=UPI00333C8B22
MRTREEHLEACKKRARAYLAKGDPVNAVTAMMKDMQDHPETSFGPETTISILGLRAAISGDPREAERYIEGFR